MFYRTFFAATGRRGLHLDDLRLAPVGLSASGQKRPLTMAIVTGETPGSLCVMKVAWRLTRIVKDHAKGVALASAQATDSMAHVHPIHAARTPDRAVMHGEDHRVPLLQGNHGGT